MPRFVPNPSLFDQLPGEVVLCILRNFIEAHPRDNQSLKALVGSTIPWQKLSWNFKLAIDAIIGMHFHTFSYPKHHGAHDDSAPWHVSTRDGLVLHRNYWNFYQGSKTYIIPVFGDVIKSLTRSRLPTLRCLSLDVRALEPISKSSLRLWKTLHAPRWVQTTLILARLATCRGIEELNIRVSPQQDLLNIIHDIVDRNKNLRIVRIDVDSTVVSNRNIRPTIRLDEMFACHLPRAPLERLVIRAPSCNIKTFASSRDQQSRLFQHLRQTKEFVLVCAVFNALLPTIIWIYHALRHMPNLELGDVAVHTPDSHKMSMKGVELALIHLHALDKLSLQIPEVDTHLLRSINALSMYKLRIKSAVPISDWPACVDNHFPNLFVANIFCPGPSALRLRALGIPHRCSYQNFGDMHNETRQHSQPFLAYIKPYSCRRNEPPVPLQAPYPPSPMLEACELGWDEEDSEATVTTGSEFSDSEDEDHIYPHGQGTTSSTSSTLTELSDSDEPSFSDSDMEVEHEGTSSSDPGHYSSSDSEMEVEDDTDSDYIPTQ
ncbi:hypothetical protein CF326_g3536 [Tilletia indica]|nr:hypothetical protein CF326_g3536 [Tilletia indica]